MQAGQVTTLAANPVLLLKKLCDIEGAVAIKTEYVDHPNSGRVYARIIADIGNGVYVEVVDWFVKTAFDAENMFTLPHVFNTGGYPPNSPWTLRRWYKQEANEGDRTLSDYRMDGSYPGACGFGFSGVATTISAQAPQAFVIPQPGALSWVHATGNIIRYSAADIAHRGIFQPVYSRWVTSTRPDGKSPFALLTGNIPPGVSSFLYINENASHSSYTNRIRPSLTLVDGAANPPRASCPLAIYCSDRMSQYQTYSDLGWFENMMTGVVCSWGGLDLAVTQVAYAAIRVGCALDSQDELVNASPWEGIPILPKIRSNANGYIAFYSDAIGNYGGGVICGKVDTSRGNKVAGNYAYVLRNYIPTWSVVEPIAPLTSLVISGGEASAGKRMNLYTPNPPVQTDSVSGGPVVADAFLYDDLEIRGIAKGVLGCNTGMTDGYMGWMDGTRYRMLTSGIMVQW